MSEINGSVFGDFLLGFRERVDGTHIEVREISIADSEAIGSDKFSDDERGLALAQLSAYDTRSGERVWDCIESVRNAPAPVVWNVVRLAEAITLRTQLTPEELAKN